MSGNTAYVSVKLANRMARRIAYLWLVKIRCQTFFTHMNREIDSFGSRLFKPVSKDSILAEAECPMDHREPQLELAVEVQMHSRYLSANVLLQITAHQCPTTRCFLMTCVYMWNQPRT